MPIVPIVYVPAKMKRGHAVTRHTKYQMQNAIHANPEKQLSLYNHNKDRSGFWYF